MKFRPYSIPPLESSLHSFGENHKEHLSGEINLFVWNVYKHVRPNWGEDFKTSVKDQNLILLQEAVVNESLHMPWLEHFPSWHWKMATSFEYKKNRFRTGIATGASAKAHQLKAVRSEDQEIFLWTPKMSLVALYRLEQNPNKELLVVNTHAVNFVLQSSFERQLLGLAELIKGHQGPVIFAGDFNTWNSQRERFLIGLTKSLGLDKLTFATDPRTLKLDHIFYRDLEVSHAEILHKINSSDHFPLIARLKT